jgi:hypothetical protein
VSEIELCEQLIYYCARNRKDLKSADNGPTDATSNQAQAEHRQKIEAQLKEGKLQASERAVENDAQRVKQGKKKRDGPSQFYYEDDSRLNLDYVLIKKFSKLGLSPPIDQDQLPKTQEQLQRLRDALKVKGELEKCEAKAKLLKEESWVQGEKYEGFKKDIEALTDDIKRCVDSIRRDKLNWAADEDDYESDGVNVTEDMDEEEVGRRFTKLRPEKKQKPANNEKPKKQAKFNADSADAFPAF